METTSLGNCKLSAFVIKNPDLTDAGRIKTSDLEVTGQISSISYVNYSDATPNSIISALNGILAIFKDDPNPPRPPAKKVNLTVCYEYHQLTPEQEGGVTLFANGNEIVNGAVVSAYQGDTVELAVAVDNEYAGFTEWSNGEETSAISFVVDDDTSISAYIAKFGSEENPFKIGSVLDLQQLSTDVSNGDCKEGVFFKQTANIDMTGIIWDGIGLLSSDYEPDLNHTFKGIYDGNGHIISNLVLHGDASEYIDDPVLSARENRYRALFRTASGTTIKNLSVQVNGFNGMANDDVTGAALVGLVKNGVTIQNCTASGFLGTSEVPVVHMTGGIICRIAIPFDTNHFDDLSASTILTNVTNNVNVTCARKTGGIIADSWGSVVMTNVTNNGNITKTGTKVGDSVGGLVGFAEQQNPFTKYTWNGVQNTGIITDAGGAPYKAGQLVGVWNAHNGHPNTNTGDVVLLNNDMPLSKNIDPNIRGMGISFGEVKEDGYIHLATEFENDHTYVYLFNNVNNSGQPTQPLSAILPDNTTISVDCRFGDPCLLDKNYSNLSATRQLVDGTIYRYTA